MQTKTKFLLPVILEDLIFLIIFSILIFITPQLILKTSELGCIISSGNFILNHFTITQPFIGVFTDVNTFYINFNWLSDVIISVIYNMGNYQLLLIFASLIIGLTYSFVYRLMAVKYPNWLINSCLLAVGIVASSDYIELNNRIFSLPLIIIVIYILDKIIDAKEITTKQYICIASLIIIWANLNTDFIFALLLIATYLITTFIKCKYKKITELEKLFKQLIRLFILSFLLCLANPSGINIFSSLFSYYLSGIYQLNGYLASPDFHITIPFKFFELVILLLIFLAAFSGYKPSLQKSSLVIVFLFLSLYSAVNIPFFIIIVLPVMADILKNTDLTFGLTFIKKIFSYTDYNITNDKPVISLIIALIVIISSSFANFTDTKAVLTNIFPLKAVEYIKDKNIQGRGFNSYSWGCYLSNNLSCSVFINERLYLTAFSTVADYSTIVNIYTNYQDLLDKHKIDWVIIPSYKSLSLLLDKNNTWQKVYDDKHSCVYTRNKDN